jgi:hypothetical protein
MADGNFSTVNANIVNSNRVNADRIEANSFGGRGGGGAVITADRIILGGWTFQAKGDGVYVTTPSGIETKMELIDFRQTPVPATAPLALQTAQVSVPAYNIGPSKNATGPTGTTV